MTLARSELILGGQRSGKSRRAEELAQQWLDAAPGRRAVMVATAEARDAEMHARIARHQADRAARVPRMVTVEEPLQLAAVLRQHSSEHTLIVVDCLTLWLTQLMMPTDPAQALEENAVIAQGDALIAAGAAAPGPLVWVSNEIGLGVIPMGREVRAFVDALGRLNQQVAALSQRVTWMVAGCPVAVKAGVGA